ncbi:hypothetical protein PPL_00789 [Heterostelium album PN500]|uniref:Uncharacterized protein n=1 Tax=Heterostelium pallidum (strain ATCC 26659 / Pp 5 / PN500) TaxID=670386 RepID=D3AXF8_HETP5|nr:hypothetical protein PPL_00789 [Heterostelium album PN500]EFA86227.1 hypothetical protein PPL_00789 [Heterostelium album PN500]|eukprot:XP_020438332.1 hypothetical protein PPL_00789 [Heterostelium album PN500]
MQHWAYVETVFVYQSTHLQNDYVNGYKAIEFVFDQSGYIVVVTPSRQDFTIYTIDLKTEQYTTQSIPNQARTIGFYLPGNMFCAQ